MKRILIALTVTLAAFGLAAPAQVTEARPAPRPAVVSSCSGIQNRTAHPDRATRYCNAGSGYGRLSAVCGKGSNLPGYVFVSGPTRYRARGTSPFIETAFNVVCPWSHPHISSTSFKTWGW